MDVVDSKLAQLERSSTSLAQFDQDASDLLLWLQDFHGRIDPATSLPSVDPKEIKKSQGRGKVLWKALAEREGVWRELQEKAEKLCKICPDSDSTQVGSEICVNLLLWTVFKIQIINRLPKIV